MHRLPGRQVQHLRGKGAIELVGADHSEWRRDDTMPSCAEGRSGAISSRQSAEESVHAHCASRRERPSAASDGTRDTYSRASPAFPL